MKMGLAEKQTQLREATNAQAEREVEGT